MQGLTPYLDLPCMVHIITLYQHLNSAESTQTIDIAGDVCESGDLFARERPMPEIEEGDILAILNAGAYAFSMASQYNSRPKPAEVQ